MQQTLSQTPSLAPSFYRRCGAILYDSLLILALFIIATALLLFLTQGQAISVGNHFYQAYLLFLWFGFILWFWIHGGQTTGMAAWRLRLVTFENKPVTIQQALLRLLLALPSCLIGGLGLFWSIWDRDNMTVYDRLSKTKLVLIAYSKKKEKEAGR